MKKVFVMTLVLIVAALSLTACGKDEPAAPTTPEPVPPTPPPAPEVPTDEVDEGPDQAAPVDNEADVLENTGDIIGSGEMRELGSKIGEVACDLETQKVTFTFANTGQYTWSLDQEVGFGASGDVRNVKIFMNGRYEMNANHVQYDPATREVMFGPNEKFSDNCGGVAELAVGEEVTCTVAPVPLNEGTGTEGLNSVNHILIDSPAIDDDIEFTC